MSDQTISELKVIHSDLPPENITWQAIARERGVVKDTGNSALYGTGKWVPKKLEFVSENCINCNLCWPVCPDDAIINDKDGNMIGIDMDHCKDCGLCVEVCPANKNPKPEKHALVFHDDYSEDF